MNHMTKLQTAHRGNDEPQVESRDYGDVQVGLAPETEVRQNEKRRT